MTTLYAHEQRVHDGREVVRPSPGGSNVLPHEPARFLPSSKPGRGLCSFGGCSQPPVVDRIHSHQVRAICAAHASELGISVPAETGRAFTHHMMCGFVLGLDEECSCGGAIHGRLQDVPLVRGCKLDATLKRTDAGIVVQAITVFRTDDGPGIDSEVLRAVHPARLIALFLSGYGPSGETPKRQRLGRPVNDTPHETFYRRVAEAYRSAAMESGRPAVVLAQENNVPVETVRRWVKEARRRGHLTGGRKGRAL